MGVKIRLILYTLFITLVLRVVSADLFINEVMANTQDDTYNEWVELYNNGSEEINVSNFIIGDESGNDTLEGGLYDGLGAIIPAGGYALITDEATRAYNNFDVSDSTIRLYVDDSSIGNGLKNSGETLYLYDYNGNLIHFVIYNETEKGKSFALSNGSWYEANCTPGYNNNGSIIYVEETIGCDWGIEIILNRTIFESRDDFEWQMRALKNYGNATLITGRATIEGLFGNVVKTYKPWTNSSSTYKKTSSKYSPSLEEGKSYIITSYLDVECDDYILSNNVDQKTITIKGSNLENSSSIEITNIYDLGSDNIAKFGQTIRLRLKVYKGDTNKNVIKAWIEDEDDKISKQSKLNAYDKFTEYEFTLPIQLKPNCDFDYEEGEYKIVVNGIDSYTESPIEVNDITKNMCETQLVYKSPSETKLYYELVDWPLEIENNKEFEIEFRVVNNDEADHEMEIWSYIYRGSKSYSGERESNLKRFLVKRKDSRKITLKNKIREAKAGEYSLMIKIVKDDQKTEKRITNKIMVIEDIEDFKEEKQEVLVKEDKTEIKEEKYQEQSTILESTKQPRVIYESPSLRAKKFAVIFFISLLLVYSVVLTWKR
ncbi:MAG: lamin tail domain-containing protein [Nanoarchaeota archaeon]|nr:lamin tail domain-containing protein [Nanoarchaeota archaeon]